MQRCHHTHTEEALCTEKHCTSTEKRPIVEEATCKEALYTEGRPFVEESLCAKMEILA